MNFVTNDLFIAENFDVVRYSVFKERSPLIADIKPFQFPELVLYSVQFLLTVGSSGLEPPTSRLSGVRSNRLSYEPIRSVFFLLDPAATYSPISSPT